MSLAALLDMCAQVGRRVPYWTQGPGSNLSWKEGDKLWIKASGFRLDEVTGERGLACVDLTRFRQILLTLGPHDEVAYSEAITACASADWGRPSMETGFHAFLPKDYVWHFHSLLAVLMGWHSRTCDLAGWAKQKIKILPGLRPGWQLSHAVAADPDCPIFLLQNHGVILQSQDVEMLAAWLQLEHDFAQEFGYLALFEEMNSANPLQVAQACYRNPAPMRNYFPDTAVFAERLAQILIPRQGGLSFSATAWQQEPSLAEIWLATQALYQVCPDLSELSEEICSQVAGLPTEVFRRQVD